MAKNATSDKFSISLKYYVQICTKITEIVAILKLKCTKFEFGWGSTPDPTGGAYSAPQTS